MAEKCPYCGKRSVYVVDDFISEQTTYYLDEVVVDEVNELEECLEFSCSFCLIQWIECERTIDEEV